MMVKGEVGLVIILSSLFVANDCKVTIHVWTVVASVLIAAVPSNILLFFFVGRPATRNICPRTEANTTIASNRMLLAGAKA
jgi:hypothetical protein